MYPMSLCEIMRDFVMSLCCFGYVSLDLVMFRWIWLCFVGFGYVSLSLLFRLCSYSWLCVVYYINDITCVPLTLCEIMRDLVMPRCFGYVSYESMRDYAGFGYAS